MVEAFMVPNGEGQILPGPAGGPTTIKARTETTNGSLTLLEVTSGPKQGPPAHVHRREDEMWYVLSGAFRFIADGELLAAPPASFVFVPRGTSHCFQNITDAQARMLVMFTPSGMERFFELHAALPDGPVDPGAYRDIDRVMARTRLRPTATGRISPDDALAFGVTLAIISVMVMGLAVNWVATALLVLTIAFYVFVYTMLLKRRTPQNIVIGGAAGAAPALVGWAAVTGSLALPAWILFALVFYWTPPHFWALSLKYKDDYAKAGVPMLPVVKGVRRTTIQIMVYAFVVVLISLALVPVAGMRWLYLATAVIAGMWFIILIAAAVGIAAVAIAPVFLTARLRNMDVPDTLRVME